jgi:hypothetical protein
MLVVTRYDLIACCIPYLKILIFYELSFVKKMACATPKFKYMIVYFVSCLYSLIVLQLSFGPIGWLMISEVFLLKLRDRGLSVAVLVNFDGQGTSGEIIFSM